MCCKIVDMREKQVICIKDGTILGCVYDVEVDTCNGKVVALVLYGKSKFFGLFGREEDISIPWDCIEVIGRDTILVNCDPPRPRHKSRRRGFFGNALGHNSEI